MMRLPGMMGAAVAADPVLSESLGVLRFRAGRARRR